VKKEDSLFLFKVNRGKKRKGHPGENSAASAGKEIFRDLLPPSPGNRGKRVEQSAGSKGKSEVAGRVETPG